MPPSTTPPSQASGATLGGVPQGFGRGGIDGRFTLLGVPCVRVDVSANTYGPKMTNFSPTTTSRDEKPNAWTEGFDDRYSSGLICLTCHSVVPRVMSHAAGHRRWHKSNGDA